MITVNKINKGGRQEEMKKRLLKSVFVKSSFIIYWEGLIKKVKIT